MATSESNEISETGRWLSTTITVTLSGTLYATSGLSTQASQDDLHTKISAVRAAFRRWNQALVLYLDDGDASSILLTPAGSLTGVQVTQPPSFSNEPGASYATYLKWTAVLQAKYPTGALPDSTGVPDDFMLTYSETVQRQGGEPQYEVLPAVNGPPQEQLVYPLTPTIITQSGQAVGYRAYPPFPAPLYPTCRKKRLTTGRSSPRQEGLILRDFQISWNYEFTFALPPPDALPGFVRSPFA